MSEKPEELNDLVQLDQYKDSKCILTLENIVKQSLIDCNTEIFYGNGKNVKIKIYLIRFV